MNETPHDESSRPDGSRGTVSGAESGVSGRQDGRKPGTRAAEGAGGRPGTGVIVRFRSITKAFGGNVVLNDLDLDIACAEKVAIIGPSGSGKTTILRLLMTLEKPDKGTIEVDGGQLWHVERRGRLVPAGERHAGYAMARARTLHRTLNCGFMSPPREFR